MPSFIYFYLFIFFRYSIFLNNILFPLIAFCFLNSSASQFYPALHLRNFVDIKNLKNSFKDSIKITLYTIYQPLHSGMI